MAESKYTAEQKEEALRLYAELGPSETERQSGIPKKTVASRATRSGMRTSVAHHMADAIGASKLTRDQKRAALVDEMLDEARNAVSDKSARSRSGTPR